MSGERKEVARSDEYRGYVMVAYDDGDAQTYRVELSMVDGSPVQGGRIEKYRVYNPLAHIRDYVDEIEITGGER